jgi:hypothetical protein
MKATSWVSMIDRRIWLKAATGRRLIGAGRLIFIEGLRAPVIVVAIPAGKDRAPYELLPHLAFFIRRQHDRSLPP